MSKLLANYLGGRRQTGRGNGVPLLDPVLGEELVRVDAGRLDLAAGFAFARRQGGGALRAMTYRDRAALLRAIIGVLATNREAYYAIATANAGTVPAHSAIDIEAAILTLDTYAGIGEALGEARLLRDGTAVPVAAGPDFQVQHVQVPTEGLALLINAFDFPSWGLWEEAAPALLSGVPVVVKPATVTAWLTQRMVRDVVEAGVLPPARSPSSAAALPACRTRCIPSTCCPSPAPPRRRP